MSSCQRVSGRQDFGPARVIQLQSKIASSSHKAPAARRTYSTHQTTRRHQLKVGTGCSARGSDREADKCTHPKDNNWRFICSDLCLGDDVLEALFGRSRMIGGHSPNSSVAELRNRFNSAMNLDYIPELERKPRCLAMFRMRHVDHLRPEHFKAELRADSCNSEAAEAILRKYGVRMAVPFAELFKQNDTDLMRPFGGKYPAILTEVDRSLAVVAAGQDTDGIEDVINSCSAEGIAIDFDALIASELAQRVAESEAGPHSVFAEIDADGRLCHKATMVRTLFDSTYDTRSSYDRLNRVCGFTLGGKSWTREDTLQGEKVSPATHFQLGNLFTSLLCYNGTHLGLVVAKCTLIKRGPLGSKFARRLDSFGVKLCECVWTCPGAIPPAKKNSQYHDAKKDTAQGRSKGLYAPAPCTPIKPPLAPPNPYPLPSASPHVPAPARTGAEFEIDTGEPPLLPFRSHVSLSLTLLPFRSRPPPIHPIPVHPIPASVRPACTAPNRQPRHPTHAAAAPCTGRCRPRTAFPTPSTDALLPLLPLHSESV
ncbi:hypothetical protein B0H14DRAFT_2599001 [Mycena olivaceomarginata]|nr:hypothetical protein B0H14DRAFT_2599001 [Mycena olivaceomarginata]